LLTSALGHDYPTILAIRQSLGKSILKSQLPNLPSTKRQLLSFLTHLLQLLLPKSSTKDIEAGCAKFVDKAVGLKNYMTEEQAVYRAYFFNSGKKSPLRLDPAHPSHHSSYRREQTSENKSHQWVWFCLQEWAAK
jgi:hypothetical protein